MKRKISDETMIVVVVVIVVVQQGLVHIIGK
jgi:hypothetical protein